MTAFVSRRGVCVGLFALVGLAACGSTSESWSNGDDVVSMEQGSAHCAMEKVGILSFSGHRYVRDPEGQVPTAIVSGSGYSASSAKPVDAVDTGYSNSESRLWISADERDLFISAGEAVERLPQVTDNLGCD